MGGKMKNQGISQHPETGIIEYPHKNLHPLYHFFIIVFLFFITSCANIGYPSGGTRDLTPPIVTREKPANKSTHFNSKNITLTFNEYVQLNDIANQVLISPAFHKIPDIKLKGKTISIPIKEELKPNTTYTFNFGNSIKDLNEGNLLDNYKYVFATGNHLDSLKISGKVFFANNKKTEKNLLVMLYDTFEDSIPMKQKPAYYSKTNEEGLFTIENVKEGKYKLFALKDMNFNMLYDLPNEQIAFSDSDIIISNVLKNYELAIFAEEKNDQKLLNAFSKYEGRVDFAFTLPADSLNILIYNPGFNPSMEKWEFSSKRDTVTYWYAGSHPDSITFILLQNGKPLDTAKVFLHSTKNDSLTYDKIRPLNGKGKKVFVSQELRKPFITEFFRPLKEMDIKKILLTEDSQQVKQTPKIFFADETKRKIKIDYAWKDTTSYTIIIPEKNITDIFGQTNDSILFYFKTKSIEEYGNLAIKIKRMTDDHTTYFLELMDEKENVFEKRNVSAEKESKIEFNTIIPVRYLIKLTRDENNNGKWDSGDYFKKIQPEKVFYYSQPINLRANWDMEIEIIVGL